MASPGNKRAPGKLHRGWVFPTWPAPAHVHACTTTRNGGSSKPPYAGFNLGAHAGDAPTAVESNRALLERTLDLPDRPVWLRQVHGASVVDADRANTERQADASVARSPGRVCAVLTADCLPVLLCDRRGTRVAAAHAGWRGLAAGVIEATVAALEVPGPELLVWLGPAIGPRAYEVGDEVREAFVRANNEAAQAFKPSSSAGRWFAELYLLARQRLRDLGVQAIYGGEYCTYEDSERFFSYRRDGRTGRMASVIWMEGLDRDGGWPRKRS